MFHQFNIAKRALLAAPRMYYSTRAAQMPLINNNNNNKQNCKEGDELHGFVVNEISRIDEMYLDAIRLTHVKTGAQYLHLNRDDSNNVFSINFRTTPMDSTGLPHILEHMTLCGSKLYPVRDPFMKMLRRSLATFMNAMTGPDYTMYPFSTQNLKDYHNLQSIYTDAVFRPRLRQLDFSQEGWRLEHSDLNDKSSPIIIKGVVFNEMKGVFNENQSIFGEKLLNNILPSHTYSVCSGGYPLDIPKLTYDALKNFHAKYYHPSNTRIYSYGNFEFQNNLKFLNDNYLNNVEKINASMSAVPSEIRWTSPRRKHITCKNDPLAPDPNRQSAFAIGYLCNDITDSQTTLELNILAELLLKGPTAAFYKSLIESNLSSGFGPFTGYDPQCKDTIFAVSLQGVKSDDFDAIEKVFDQTVDSVIESGFEKDHVQAVLHGMEIKIKHQVSNFGMNLLFGITPLWNHDGNLIESMRINGLIKNFNAKLQEDPKYLNKLVEKYIKNNNHRLVLTMSPDSNYQINLQKEEDKLLEEKLKQCSKDELDKIYDNGLILRKDQEKTENFEVLPTLKINDLKEDTDRYITEDIFISNVPLQLSVQPTNGISYYRGVLNINKLDDDLKQLIPLFNTVIARMGTKIHDYRSFDRLCQLKTGGLHFSSHIAEEKDSIDKYEEGIVISSYCLDRNASNMWDLWKELFNQVDLQDIKRFETLVKIEASDLSTGIADYGHVYAMSSAASLISPVGKFKENISGLEYVGRMKKIAQVKEFLPIFNKIKSIKDKILNKSNLRTAINLSGSDNERKQIIKGLEGFYDSLDGQPGGNSIKLTHSNSLLSSSDALEKGIHYIMPYDTNYTSKTLLTVPYNHPDYAPLRVLAKLISSVYLLREVREKEGAYGSGANISPDGVFTFFSFRDPNSTKTFDTFDNTHEFLMNFNLKQTDLDESKLGVFQKIDTPVAPSDRGLKKFLMNLTDDDVQTQRIRLKNVTKEDIIRVAQKYLNPGADDVKIGRAIIGPANTNLVDRKTQNWRIIQQDC
ncbi:GSCOCG00004797001-RA-CDS [Cotesia congregata]|uniref:Presequence protease, mitochondrial n=1 Tax=Cotesia congregata TaxID=51543 RepID=A0A8J2MGZ3_COTCN|nr:GSCOCG00004797001-RA-CDS [Cotesia congregata]CAG5092010.1 Similar to pitrm1: Presequence protease [Cotesia congregata]